MNKTFLAFFLLLSQITQANEWIRESLYDTWGQTFLAEEILHEEKTDEQHLMIFQNAQYGKVLVLDGIIQTTEVDEFVYHEMLTHIPLLSHGNAKNVLIIGGGDGGILREVLKHNTVEKATLVEIDASVIDFSKKHLPNHSKGAFEDPRTRVVIADGALFIKNTEEKFDVIICDSTDPIGPAAILFKAEFYKNCHDKLTEKGIFVNQNGVPFLQENELKETYQAKKKYFNEVSFYLGVVPTYVGGFMAFGWATDSTKNNTVTLEELKIRMKNIDGECKYYTPAIHKASFVLPRFIEKAIDM